MSEISVETFVAQLKQFARIINDREMNLRLGRKCQEIIYRRVKSGYGVTADNRPAEETERAKLKELSASYIAYRRGDMIFRTIRGRVVPFSKTFKETFKYDGDELVGRGKRRVGKMRWKKPKLGEFGRVAKSNLTLTGQMLNAMVVIADREGFKIIIANTPRFKPDGTPDKLTNKRVSELVAANGRPFFALTAGEMRILNRELETVLRQRLAKLVR